MLRIFSAFAAAVAAIATTGAMAQTRANGETLRIQFYSGAMGSNLPGVVADRQGFCEKYNFKCEFVTLNAGAIGLQALVGKSIDVAITGINEASAAAQEGARVMMVGAHQVAVAQDLVIQSNLNLPNRDKGYPAVIQDFKGMKIGVTSRGSASEQIFAEMLKEAGLPADYVTYVATGSPVTTYASLTVGKQIEAAITYEPVIQLCNYHKKCEVLVSVTDGDGPQAMRDQRSAFYSILMHKDLLDSNPNLAHAYVAAMRDANAWVSDPANFPAVREIAQSLVDFSTVQDGDKIIDGWVKVNIANLGDLSVNRDNVAKILQRSGRTVTVDQFVWDGAPRMQAN